MKYASPDSALGQGRQLGGSPPTEASDADLLAALALGQEDLFWELWSRHRSHVHQVCLHLMDGRLADAEDALSLVMLKAWDRLPANAGLIECPEAWLHRLARNLCLDLRRERHRTFEPFESWQFDVQGEPAASQHPHLDREATSELEYQITTLPPALRASFVRHVVEEIPAKEVALELGISHANVRKRVQQARSRLQAGINLPPKSGPGEKASKQRRPRAEAWQTYSLPVACCTVQVKMPCGVEELFHIYPATPPFALERKKGALQKQVQAQPNRWRKRIALAELCYQTGDWRQAVDEWQLALKRQPDLSTALKLGDALWRMGEQEMAAAVFEKYGQLPPASAATRQHFAAWRALCQSNPKAAARAFQMAAKLEPKNPAHWLGLARAQGLSGAPAKAWLAMRSALDLNPKNPADDLLSLRRVVTCRCRLGWVHGNAGRETKRLLRRALRLTQNPLLMREPMSAFFLSQGETQKARELWLDFARQHPQCPQGQKAAGATQMAKG
jgi:RNA polymerase sigma factor (sigma-70 family)